MTSRSSSLATMLVLSLGTALSACSSDDNNGGGTGGTTAGGSGGTRSGGSGGTSNGGSSGAGGSVSTGGSSGAGGSVSTGGSSGAGGRASGGASGDARASGGASGDARGSGGSGGGSGDGGGAGVFKLTGSDFNMAGMRVCFKQAQTANTNESPPLSWSGAPEGTKSFAIVLRDTDNGNTHWIMWDIPATVTSLDAKLPKGVMPGPPAPAGTTQRGSSFAGGTTNPGYFGPGADYRRYDFEFHAMKVEKFMAGNAAVNALRTTLMSSPDKIATTVLPVWGSRGGNACN